MSNGIPTWLKYAGGAYLATLALGYLGKKAAQGAGEGLGNSVRDMLPDNERDEMLLESLRASRRNMQRAAEERERQENREYQENSLAGPSYAAPAPAAPPTAGPPRAWTPVTKGRR